MIKYINTKITPKEVIIKEIKEINLTITEVRIINEIIDPMYQNYDECLYNYRTNKYVAFKPKDNTYWIENVNSTLMYVETHITPKNNVINDLSLSIGSGSAVNIVNSWYEKNSAFVYDRVSADIIFSKSRFAGYWTENMNILSKYIG